MIFGTFVGLSVMLCVWFSVGAERGTAIIGGTLLNMAVFGAMLSYIMQALSFLLLRSKFPDMHRPYVSPLGKPGAFVTTFIAILTLVYQLADPTYRVGVIAVAVWIVLGATYFFVYGRHKLILSPEEEFAQNQQSGTR